MNEKDDDLELDGLLAGHRSGTGLDAVPEQLGARTVETMLAAGGRAVRPRNRVRLWAGMSGVAAALVLGLVVVLMNLGSKDGMAFAVVAAKMEAYRSLRGVVVRKVDGVPDRREKWAVLDDRILVEYATIVTMSDERAKKSWTLETGRGLLVRQSKRLIGFDPIKAVRDLGREAAFRGDKEEYGGRIVWKFSGKTKVPSDDGKKVPARVEVWADAESLLPVRLTVEVVGEGQKLDVGNMEFGAEVTPSEMEPPARLVKRMVEEGRPVGEGDLDAALSEATREMILVPGLSVGPLDGKTGEEQLIAALGIPEREAENSVTFLSAGVVLRVAEDRDGAEIECVEGGKLGQDVILGFQGATDRGLRIGSSTDEVQRLYGKPDRVETRTTGERWTYGALRLSLRDGKVRAMATTIKPK